MRRICFALAALLVGASEAHADEARYFIYGNECVPSKDGNPPVCHLVGWPANSGQAQLHGLPWIHQVGPKADKGKSPPTTQALALPK